MKTVFAFLAALVLLAAVERPAQAAVAPTVSVTFFYDALAPYGDWVAVEGYGYCFRPAVSLEDPGWRPYTEGSWIYTDAGWTWDSDEDFGWATYHYGGWFLLGGTWLWHPGEVWGPAWVSWRADDEYIGWAPLPPEAEWRSDTGFGIYVDLDFNIGPACYNFVPIHNLGERRLRQWIEPWQRNAFFMRRTENCTRISHRSGDFRLTAVFNDGPDFARLSRHTDHPIRRMKLSERDDVDLREARAGRLRNQTENDRFRVIAPTVLRPGTNQPAPKTVSHRFDRTQVNRGWEGFREEEVRDLRQKVDTVRRSDTASTLPPADTRTNVAEADKRMRVDSEVRKAIPLKPDRGDDEKPRVTPGDPQHKIAPINPNRVNEEHGRTDEDVRKAVPLPPPLKPDRVTEERVPIGPDANPKHKVITPTIPGRDRTVAPDRFRIEPQDQPPRTTPGTKPNVNKPQDTPPGPLRKMPGDDTGNSQRNISTGTENIPKLKPGRDKPIENAPRLMPQERVVPQERVIPPVKPPPEPQGRTIEPRKIEPTKPEPKIVVPPDVAPPQNIQRPPDDGSKPTGKPSGNKKDEDDDKKKKPH